MHEETDASLTATDFVVNDKFTPMQGISAVL